MDEYGCFSDKDLSEIANLYNETKNILISYSEDQIGAIIVNINGAFQKHGIMPFGGNPSGRIIISVYGRGMNHFGLNSDHNYISEKLSIGADEAKWIENILKSIIRSNCA